jgi:MFS family permease
LNARVYLTFTFLLSLYVGISNVIFNLYILKLGYNEQSIGLLISASLIATGLFAFPAARCCDRMGSRMCLVTSGLLTAVSMYLLYTVTSMELLLALSVLNGVFATIPTVIGVPFLMENSTQEDRLHIFSVNFGIFVFATVIGTSLGGYLPQVCAMFFGMPEMSVEAYRYTLMVSLAVAALSWSRSSSSGKNNTCAYGRLLSVPAQARQSRTAAWPHQLPDRHRGRPDHCLQRIF